VLKRESFASSVGVIAAAAGSAVGLGNIWRFPYITGQGGGAAFIIVYLFFIVFIGMSCLLTEFLIGRKSRSDAIGAFLKLAPGKPWVVGGWIVIVTVILIFSFYVVIFGWTLDYLVKSLLNAFSGLSANEIGQVFTTTTSAIYTPIIYTFLSLTFCGGFV